METLKSGWLKFYRVFDSESREEVKKDIQRHWFILRPDGLLFHSKEKAKIESYGSYVKVASFDTITDSDEEFGFVGCMLTNKLSYYFIGASDEERQEWMKALHNPLFAEQEENKLSLKKKLQSNPMLDIQKSDDEILSPKEGALTNRKQAKLLGSTSESFIHRTRTVKDPQTTIRTLYSLYVKMSEARNLQGIRISNKGEIIKSDTPNPYASVALEHAWERTQTIAKSTGPLWAEEFNLEVENPEVSALTVYVWDENKSSKDRVIGKLTLPIKQVKEDVKQEDWYPLTFVPSASVATGDIHVRIEFPKGGAMILFTVVEGRNVCNHIHSSQDLLVKVTYGKTQLFKTKTLHKTLNPDWNETFQLKFEPMSKEVLLQVVKVGTSKLNPKSSLLGQVRIPIDRVVESRYIDEWYVLEPDMDEALKELDLVKNKFSLMDEKFGDVRLTLSLSKSLVLPLAHYEDLIQLLLTDPWGCVQILEKTAAKEHRDRVANMVVRIYEARNQAPTIIKNLISHEVEEAHDVETLFRANSIGSKAFDMYMKMCGFHFLYDIVHPTVSQIYEEKRSMEVDPSKMDKGDDAKKNFKRLTTMLDQLLQKIYASADLCPTSLREIFAHLSKEVSRRFPQEPNIKYIGVSGFLFLRFICAAILGPKLFSIMPDHPESKVAKTLTLVAKTVQKIASMVPANPPSTDPILAELDQYVEKQQEKMKKYIDVITTESDNHVFNPASVDMGKEISSLVEYLKEQKEPIANLSKDKDEVVASMATRIQQLVTELCNKAQEITPRDDSSSNEKSEDAEESSDKHSGSTPGLVKSKSVTDASDERRRKRLSVGSSGEFSGQSPLSSALAGSKAKKFFGDVGTAAAVSSPGKSPKEKKEKRRKSSSHHRDEKRINEEK